VAQDLLDHRPLDDSCEPGLAGACGEPYRLLVQVTFTLDSFNCLPAAFLDEQVRRRLFQFVEQGFHRSWHEPPIVDHRVNA